jgi:chromosome segregation ATPase
VEYVDIYSDGWSELPRPLFKLPFNEADLLRELLERERSKVGVLSTAVNNYLLEMKLKELNMITIQEANQIIEAEKDASIAKNIDITSRLRTSESNCVRLKEEFILIEQANQHLDNQTNELSAEYLVVVESQKRVGLELNKLKATFETEKTRFDSVALDYEKKLECAEGKVGVLLEQIEGLIRELSDTNLTVKSLEQEKQAFTARKEYLESSLEKLDVENISLMLNAEQCDATIQSKNLRIEKLQTLVNTLHESIKELNDKRVVEIATTKAECERNAKMFLDSYINESKAALIVEKEVYEELKITLREQETECQKLNFTIEKITGQLTLAEV